MKSGKMVMSKGFEVVIGFPVASEYLTVPADQTPLCAACPEILVTTTISTG